jgi:hypothetical protein
MNSAMEDNPYQAPDGDALPSPARALLIKRPWAWSCSALMLSAIAFLLGGELVSGKFNPTPIQRAFDIARPIALYFALALAALQIWRVVRRLFS